MPWKTMDVKNTRAVCGGREPEEKSFSACARSLGSRGRRGMRWRERYRANRAGGDRRAQPEAAAESEADAADWSNGWWRCGDVTRLGARELQVLLAREGVPLTRSTMHRILLRHDLVRESERHRQALQRFERGAPNELWQMDYKSPEGWNAAMGLCRCWTITAAICWCCRRCGAITERMVREQLETALGVAGCPTRC